MHVLDHLYRQAVLPVLRSASWSEARDTVGALRTCGCAVVELTTSTPDWPDAVRALAGSGSVVGVGTIRSVEDARRALDSGAAFLVSPFPVTGVAELAERAAVPFVQGGLTPGELHLAASRMSGAAVVKVFPAHLGGPRYLRSLAPVLPGVRLVPTGGIGWDEVPAYLAAGAFAVGIGSGLDLPTAELTAAFARVRRR